MKAKETQMSILKSGGIITAFILVIGGLIYAQIEWGITGFTGSYPGDEFFELAAQTIPILLVALAVEAQARRLDRSEAGKLRVAAVILLALGETSAILVSAGLFDPDPGTALSKAFVVVTAGGLLGGFGAVIAVALAPSPKHSEEREQAPIVQAPTIGLSTSELASHGRVDDLPRVMATVAAAAIGALLSIALLQAKR